MTQQPWPEEFIVGSAATPADFNTARVAFIEAFSLLEGCLAEIIVMSDPQFDLRAPFGSKLKALVVSKPTSFSKKAADRFANLGSEITTLVQIRNDLVHGIMSMVIHEAKHKAAFQNAADIASKLPQFTLVSLDELKAGRHRLRQITNELRQLANPPLPPRPLPDATGDP